MQSFESQKLLDLKHQVNRQNRGHNRTGTDVGFKHMMPPDRYKNVLHPISNLTPSKNIHRSRSSNNAHAFLQKGNSN